MLLIINIIKCTYIIMTSASFFLMSVTGQIEWIDVLAPSGSSLHCKYEFAFGPDWRNINGLDGAVSQLVNVITNGEKVIFNFPIDITFKSTNLYQWPQIILSVYNNMKLVGYGRAYIPFQPKLHTVNVTLVKPESSTLLGYLSSFFGYQPELVQPKLLANSLGNDMIVMSSNGKARLSLNVVQQGLHKLGYDVGK